MPSRWIKMKKIILILLYLCFFLLASCNRNNISYKITNGYGKWSSQIARNKESFERIKNTGAAIYIEFNDIYSTSYQPFSVHIFSLEDFKLLELKDVYFAIDEKKIYLPLNKQFTVETNKSDFAVEDSSDLKVSGYEYILWRNEHNLRINFSKIFKEVSFSIGKDYTMSVFIDYRLDSKCYSQKITYKILPYKMEGSTEWIYTIFPDVGI